MNSISKNDILFLKNSEMFERKSRVTKEFIALLVRARDEMRLEIEKQKIIFPGEMDVLHGKISKGENYKGYPWLVLDYPKFFSRDSITAFRTIFWWGNEISFTLLLYGKAFEERKSAILKKIPSLKKKKVFICISKTPWEHHFKKENYVSLDSLNAGELKKIISENSFLKISRKLSIEKLNTLPYFCKESFRLFTALAD